MGGRKGFLLAMMEPPAEIDEEFNDWYDTEHIPERMRVPGFESARRFVCVSGWPRYMTIYDLASPEVLRHEQYLAVSGAGRGPWTRRLHGKHRGLYRTSGVQVFPGDAMTGDPAFVMLARVRDSDESLEPMIIDALRSATAGRPEVLSLRLFRSEGQGPIDHIVLIEAAAATDDWTLQPSMFATAAIHVDAVNTYVPYAR